MTTQHSISPRAWVELSLLACLWGASFLSIRITLNEVPVLTSVFYRCAGGAVVL